jgi:hypothetical protein
MIKRDMKQLTEPIHRWCSFSDSWPPSAVRQIVSLLEVNDAEWIWDPFGGAGTTAIVATSKGIRSITSDIDPLAALVAKIKTDPPSEHVIEDSVWREVRSLEQVFCDLTKHSALSRSVIIRTMRFLITASLLRTGWHLGEPFNERRVRTEFSLLKNEMLSDRSFQSSRARSIVYCTDFLELVPLVRRSTRSQAVMITSPPFPGSNDNPKLLKLKRAVGLLKEMPNRRKHISFRDYRRMLDSIVYATMQVGCRMVAIELSARKPGMSDGNEWPPEFLVRKLERAGYSTSLLPFNTGGKDPSVLCLGKQSRTKSRLPKSRIPRLT